jgi:hypothetical protein
MSDDIDEILEDMSRWTDAEVRASLLAELREDDGAKLRALMSACSKNGSEWCKTVMDILRRCPDLQDLLPH